MIASKCGVSVQVVGTRHGMAWEQHGMYAGLVPYAITVAVARYERVGSPKTAFDPAAGIGALDPRLTE